MKDTEGHGKTRRGCCPRGKGTESYKEGGSDSGEANWDGTEKGPLASATWRPLVDLAGEFQEVMPTVEAGWSGLGWGEERGHREEGHLM